MLYTMDALLLVGPDLSCSPWPAPRATPSTALLPAAAPALNSAAVSDAQSGRSPSKISRGPARQSETPETNQIENSVFDPPAGSVGQEFVVWAPLATSTKTTSREFLQQFERLFGILPHLKPYELILHDKNTATYVGTRIKKRCAPRIAFQVATYFVTDN